MGGNSLGVAAPVVGTVVAVVGICVLLYHMYLHSWVVFGGVGLSV